MNDTEGLAKYLVAIVRLNPNDEESVELIMEKLKELVNSELNSCLELIDNKEKEWGETAIRVNKITKDLIKEVSLLKL